MSDISWDIVHLMTDLNSCVRLSSIFTGRCVRRVREGERRTEREEKRASKHSSHVRHKFFTTASQTYFCITDFPPCLFLRLSLVLRSRRFGFIIHNRHSTPTPPLSVPFKFTWIYYLVVINDYHYLVQTILQ